MSEIKAQMCDVCQNVQLSSLPISYEAMDCKGVPYQQFRAWQEAPRAPGVSGACSISCLIVALRRWYIARDATVTLGVGTSGDLEAGRIGDSVSVTPPGRKEKCPE